MDDVRPRGTVEVTCGGCGWAYWVACDDPVLPNGPFRCVSCESENADAELRAMGVDPDELGRRGLGFVNKTKAELGMAKATADKGERT